MLVPGAVGDWLTKLMPGNAGSPIATVESFNPLLLDPWPGFAVFCAETALLLGIATVRFIRRDA
jgi:ABC-2 type transport system permease protein